MKNKRSDFFSLLNQLFYKNRDIKYDPKTMSPYAMMFWLSNDFKLIKYVNTLNKVFGEIPDKLKYEYFFSKIPKGGRFIKYTKKTKSEYNFEEKISEIMELGYSRKEAIIIYLHNKRLKGDSVED